MREMCVERQGQRWSAGEEARQMRRLACRASHQPSNAVSLASPSLHPALLPRSMLAGTMLTAGAGSASFSSTSS